MKTFKDLKVGDVLYYSDQRIIEKYKILNIRDTSILRKYLIGINDEFIVPISQLNLSYSDFYGIYADPECVLEKINEEYENSTLDIK